MIKVKIIENNDIKTLEQGKKTAIENLKKKGMKILEISYKRYVINRGWLCAYIILYKNKEDK